MGKNPVYIETFKQLGVESRPSQILIGLLEDFVCHLYKQSNVSNVNDARNNMFKLGKCTEESLAPNSDSLQQHIMRCNYESFIRRRYLVAIRTFRNAFTLRTTPFGWKSSSWTTSSSKIYFGYNFFWAGKKSTWLVWDRSEIACWHHIRQI